MKRLLLVLLIVPFIFNSCKDDDDQINDTSGSVLGSWKIDTFAHTYSEGFLDPVLGTEVITYTETFTGDGYEWYLTFRYDNTLLDYQIYDDTLVYIDTIDYLKTGNVILMYDVAFTITELSNTNLSYNLTSFDYTYLENDTTFFDRITGYGNFSKSIIPSFSSDKLNNKKSVKERRSFFDRRKNR